jgi:hypothetical protein
VAAQDAARRQRVEAIRAGEQVVGRELPALLSELRAPQARLTRFTETLDALDGPVPGGGYFATWTPAPLVQRFEAWIGVVTEAFLERKP